MVRMNTPSGAGYNALGASWLTLVQRRLRDLHSKSRRLRDRRVPTLVVQSHGHAPRIVKVPRLQVHLVPGPGRLHHGAEQVGRGAGAGAADAGEPDDQGLPRGAAGQHHQDVCAPARGGRGPDHQPGQGRPGVR